MNRKTWWIISVVAVLITGLVAGVHPGPQAIAGAPAVKVTLKEYAILPKAITVDAGAKQVTITNRGALEHNFVIDALKVKSPLVKTGAEPDDYGQFEEGCL